MEPGEMAELFLGKGQSALRFRPQRDIDLSSMLDARNRGKRAAAGQGRELGENPLRVAASPCH